MALTPSTTVVHLPFAEREAYGSPYPAGIAVGHIDVTGDASGGTITASFLAPDGFLYRLELFNATKDDEVNNSVTISTLSSWASQQSGFGATAFTLNWMTAQLKQNGFSQYMPNIANQKMLARQIIGSLNPGAGQFLSVATAEDNVLNDVWDFDIMLSYWPRTALYVPGFLSSFYEAPEVAPAF